MAFSGNTHPELKQAILRELQMQEMQVGSSYFGLPLYLPHSKKTAFSALKANVVGKLVGWKARVLSQAGHTVLLKSVATAMPLYHMSSVLMTKSRCADLDRLFKDFWWGFDPLKSRNFNQRLGLRFVIQRNVEVWAYG